MSSRQDKERESRLQPKRIQKAVDELNRRKIQIISIDETSVKFNYKDNVITFYPYSGWHSGKGIKDGRGFNKLINQINK